jgi:hypothetical protein
MPTDWAAKVRRAITKLKIPGDRVVEPDQALALMDDVVAGRFAAGDLAMIHGIPEQCVRTTLGQVTRALGRGRARSLEAGDWYAFRGHEQPYAVAPGFAAAWKRARAASRRPRHRG